METPNTAFTTDMVAWCVWWLIHRTRSMIHSKLSASQQAAKSKSLPEALSVCVKSNARPDSAAASKRSFLKARNGSSSGCCLRTPQRFLALGDATWKGGSVNSNATSLDPSSCHWTKVLLAIISMVAIFVTPRFPRAALAARVAESRGTNDRQEGGTLALAAPAAGTSNLTFCPVSSNIVENAANVSLGLRPVNHADKLLSIFSCAST